MRRLIRLPTRHVMTLQCGLLALTFCAIPANGDRREATLGAPPVNPSDSQATADSTEALPALDDQFTGILSVEIENQIQAALLPLREVSEILEANPRAAPDSLAKAVEVSRRSVASIEAKTSALSADDVRSLFWTPVLSNAWCVAGWAALETRDLATAETYLRASWLVSQDKTSGFLLAQLLDAKGDKAEAAHLYDLAGVARADNPLGLLGFSFLTNYQTEEGHAKWALKLLPDSIPSAKEYKSPLRGELSKFNEVRLFAHPTKLDGTALFLVSFEPGKPTKALWYGDDAPLASLAHTIEMHTFAPTFPADSKARLLREIRVVCKPETGCSAYFQLPTRIDIPSTEVNMDIFAHGRLKGMKMVSVQLEPE